MNEELIYKISHLISLVPGLDEYLTSQGSHDILSSIETYTEILSEKDSLDSENRTTLQIIKETIRQYTFNSHSYLHSIDHTLKIDDKDIIVDFESKLKNCHIGHKFKLAEVQHYKTYTEKLCISEYDLNPIINDYVDCWHPYICSKIGIAYTSAKNYDIGLTFLQRALCTVFSCPNIYWNNLRAVEGCILALHEVQHLLGRQGLFGLDNIITLNLSDILSLLYLYISRIIYMSDNENAKNCRKANEVYESDIDKINYYSIRADLEYDYKCEYAYIFDFGMNPDIQFLSDKYMSYLSAEECGLTLVAQQAYWDALKMYRHGSLIPNSTGGYEEIEDATFGELVKRGNIRSDIFTYKVFKEFENGKFMLDKPKITLLINHIREIKGCYNHVDLPWYNFKFS